MKAKPRLTDKVLDGLADACVHARMVLEADLPDGGGYGPLADAKDWSRFEAAEKWLAAMRQHRAERRR